MQEVWDSLLPALKPANALRRNDALVPILRGLFSHVLCRGRVAESLRWAAQLMNAAESCGDPDLVIVGHHAAATAYFWLGDPIKSRQHADRVLALYSEERHGHLVGILNQDPKTSSLVFSAQSSWMLGFPERALRISDAKDAHARRRGHPFDLGLWALTTGARVFWEERHHYAEALRIKGWLLQRKGDPEGAERAFLASLDWARTQQAKSWELRTATSYARLMRDQGRVREAHGLLAPIYGWFTEGFGTKDLMDAKALLDALRDGSGAAVGEGAVPVAVEPPRG